MANPVPKAIEDAFDVFDSAIEVAEIARVSHIVQHGVPPDPESLAPFLPGIKSAAENLKNAVVKQKLCPCCFGEMIRERVTAMTLSAAFMSFVSGCAEE